MIKKRMIFTLFYADGFFMLSRNFRLQKVGDINWLIKNYKFEKIAHFIDELVILNLSKDDNHKFHDIVLELSKYCFIPICCGGGIRNMEDARLLMQTGADKLIINTSLHSDKIFISELVTTYGSQCIVGSIDYKLIENNYFPFINNGTEKLNIDIYTYINMIMELKIGELYITSIDKDGTGFGYDTDLIQKIEKIVKIPLIASGGDGKFEHLVDVFHNSHVDAISLSNLFNFIGDNLKTARTKLLENNISLANWKEY